MLYIDTYCDPIFLIINCIISHLLIVHQKDLSHISYFIVNPMLICLSAVDRQQAHKPPQGSTVGPITWKRRSRYRPIHWKCVSYINNSKSRHWTSVLLSTCLKYRIAPPSCCWRVAACIGRRTRVFCSKLFCRIGVNMIRFRMSVSLSRPYCLPGRIRAELVSVCVIECVREVSAF